MIKYRSDGTFSLFDKFTANKKCTTHKQKKKASVKTLYQSNITKPTDLLMDIDRQIERDEQG